MKANGNTDCKRVSALLGDFAAGAGSARGRDTIQRHLSVCPECTKELRALERTAQLLNQTSLEPAPDLWEIVQPRLAPRRAPDRIGRIGSWFARHRLQSAVAAAASIAIAALFFGKLGTPPAEIDAQTYFVTHASMSWREPFADKAVLGLAAVAPVDTKSEDIQR